MNAIILSAICGVLMMFSGVFFSSKESIRILAIIGLLVLLAGNIADLYGCRLFHVDTHGMLSFSSFSLLFNTIVFGATLFYFLLSSKDIVKVGIYPAEYFALIFFVLCGISIVVAFNTLLMLFIGIEIISIPLYILTGSNKHNLKSNEAALKYFLMGAFSTGIMLMGIALIYGARGTFSITDIRTSVPSGFTPLLVAGMLLLIISMSFKVSAAPFHFWTPDVYDGAPTVFTSFMATIVKAGVFVAFFRLLDGIHGAMPHKGKLVIAIITAATLFIGNITAVFQQSVKRMLAYSSIAQAGFMLFALFSYNDISEEGLLLYTAAYCLATIGIFAVLIRMKDYTFEGFNGMGKHHPLLAAVTTIFLLSLAGIPLTAGFTAKFYMLAAVIRTESYLWLVIFAVLCAAISVYYYFRVIQAMYFKEGEKQELELSGSFKVCLLLVAALIILIGVYPQLIFYKLYF
jgi:NADH-quinone oxidoreductase subunit N